MNTNIKEEMAHYVDLHAPTGRQTLSITTPWADSPLHKCLRMEIYTGEREGAAATFSEVKIQFYRPEVVDELIAKLQAARERLWPHDSE